jgi:hypothetical protein
MATATRQFTTDELERIAGPGARAAVSAAVAAAADLERAVFADGGPEPATRLRDALDARFQVRVARHVVAMIERELAAGPSAIAREHERLVRLNLVAVAAAARDDPSVVRTLQASVAREVRAGAADARLEAVAAVLREGLRERLQVARPGWDELEHDLDR